MQPSHPSADMERWMLPRCDEIYPEHLIQRSRANTEPEALHCRGDCSAPSYRYLQTGEKPVYLLFIPGFTGEEQKMRGAQGFS